MTDIDLLPLPEEEQLANPYAHSFGSVTAYGYTDEAMRDYARANVARNTALLRAEIEALREQLRLATVDQVNAEAEANDARAEAEALRKEVERLQEIVRPKREDECLTLDHWRMRAYYLEENWSRCSHACAVEQTKREQAEARAKRLAGALRELHAKIDALLRDQEEGHEQ